jgi:hypothetical protein
MEEIRIRDVSRIPTREWIPPIGAMGGPPAHELYRDLVLYAGLRLVRNSEGTPLVAMRDGEHRRTFRVPSDELREALDRFRMRRNLRPLPEHDLSDLARLIQARATDPDIVVPTFDVGEADTLETRVESRPTELRVELRPPERRAEPRPPLLLADPPKPKRTGWIEELDSIMREVDRVRLPAPPRAPVAKAPSAWNDVVEHLEPFPTPVAPTKESVSGGQRSPEPGRGLPRYVQVLQGLMRDGGWLGTTSELSRLTGDSPEKVFANLRAYRTELAGNNVVVVPVETDLGWRWLAVDRSRLNTS